MMKDTKKIYTMKKKKIFTNKQKWKVWPFRNVGFVVLASTKFNPSSVCSDFSESQTG